MDVQEQVDANALHVLQHEQHFRAVLGVGRLPGAVEVLPGVVGAQMPPVSAIRIHVRHQVQFGLGQQRGDLGVIGVLQALDQPLHEPLGHVLAGMLLGDDPQLTRRRSLATDTQQLDIAPLQAATAGHQLGTTLQRRTDQALMACPRIGFEVGEPGLLALGLQLEVQLPVGEARGYAKPVLLVVAGHGLVAVPGLVVGRLPSVGQAEAMALADLQAVDLKVEPLKMMAVEIWPHGQQYSLRVTGIDDLDIATVEIRTDLHDCLADETGHQDCS